MNTDGHRGGGGSDFRRAQRPRSISAGLGCIILVAILGLSGITLYFQLNEARVLSDGVAGKALVSEVYFTRRLGHIVFDYTIESKRYSGKHLYNPYVETYKVGEIVPIYVLPEDPSSATLNVPRSTRFQTFIMSYLVSAILVVAGVFFAFALPESV